MQRSLSGTAAADETRHFGARWQDRVRRILLDHGGNPEVLVVRRAGLE